MVTRDFFPESPKCILECVVEDAQEEVRGMLSLSFHSCFSCNLDLPPPSSARKLPTLLSLGLQTDAGQVRDSECNGSKTKN